MMVLTNWYSPYKSRQGERLTRSWPAVWVKMGSSSACLWLYTWVLLAPVFRQLINDDEGETEEEKESIELQQTNLVSYKDDIGKFTSPKAFSSPKVVADTKTEELRPRVEGKLQNGENKTSSKQYKNSEASQKANGFSAEKNVYSVTRNSSGIPDVGTKQQPLSEADKEMFRLQEKILKIQSKIAKLQSKVAVLQGFDV